MYLCRDMGYAKERGKFEKLSTKISGLTVYDDKSLAIITDVFEQYSHAIRILKNKNPELFNDAYQTELQEVKVVRRALKEGEEADRQERFISYRDRLVVALQNAIGITNTTV